MTLHFIGIGERIMGDLAIALHQQGHTVTGSDDTLAEPTLQRLESSGLLPATPGWLPQKMTQALDQVVVGRQVQVDNPELQAAQQQGLPVCSYAEYIYTYAQDKQRIVVTGGAEKSLLCVVALHVLTYLRKEFDYVVDARALASSVHLSDAPIILLEADAAPPSPTDLQPQSVRYQHNVLLVSGIGWEANKSYPTLETYLQYVSGLADASPKSGTLIYCEENSHIKAIGSQARADVKQAPYQAHPHRHAGEQAYLVTPQGDIPFPYADKAAMQAVAGAQQLTRNLAITDQQFYEALATFRVA